MTISKKIAITVRKFFILLFFSSVILSLHSCLNNHQDKMDRLLAEENAQRRYRIHEIQERGKLIAVTEYNSTDYFIYRGEPMGFQYEKLKMFADYLGVDLEIKVSQSLDEAFNSLDEGEADLIALGLTVTLERNNDVDFTQPILQTRQMLVQRKPDNWRKMRTWDDIEGKLIRNQLDMASKTVVVHKGSAYAGRLENLSEEIGAIIDIQQDPIREVEQLVEAVAKGEIDYTVCDEHMATLFERLYPEIDAKTPVSFPQNIAWAVRHGSDSLRIAVNQWLSESNTTLAAQHLVDKYYKSTRTVYMAKSEYASFNQGKISAYDDMLKDLSRKYDLDWRLVASLVYQESQFKPEVRSWAGAFGLMQLMPATAALLGVDSTSSDAEQLDAGIRYLKALDRELPREIKDPDERIKFILAAYNVGIAHVFDARRLAEKNGKDPNVWTGNVDYYILNKSNPDYYRDSVVRYGYARGEETYNFVKEILDRFEHYKNVITD